MKRKMKICENGFWAFYATSSYKNLRMSLKNKQKVFYAFNGLLENFLI